MTVSREALLPVSILVAASVHNGGLIKLPSGRELLISMADAAALRAAAELDHRTSGEPVIKDHHPAASEINRYEDTPAGRVDWKMEAERANRLLAAASHSQEGEVPERETWWLVERMGTGQYVKHGAAGLRHDLTDNVWHAERWPDERSAFEFVRLSESPWAKDLRATEHVFINKYTASQAGSEASSGADKALADKLQALCCAETEGKFFDLVTDSIQQILAALRRQGDVADASFHAYPVDTHRY